MRTAAAVMIAAWVCAAWAQRTVDMTKPAAPNGSVRIENVSGKLDVVGWDRSEIQVTGTIGEDVEEVRFEVDGNEAEIEVRIPNRRGRVDGRAELKVQVPANSTLDIEVVSVPITITGVTGPEIDIESVSGGITVTDCRGELRAETVSGDVRVDGAMTRAHVESVSGAIAIGGVSESVHASTTSGRIEVSAGALRSVQIEALSASVVYAGGLVDGGKFDIESFSGGVTVTFTNDVYGEYDIETFSGRISVPYGPEPRRASRFGPGHELKFTHGNGSSRVKIETFSGSVTIKR